MQYRIPLFDLNFDEAETAAVVRTLAGRWISMGPQTEKLEATFAARLGVESSVALGNCTAALHLALRILGVGPGDEVIVPSLTFVATAACIRYVDATPVFCDIHGPRDLTIDPAAIERAVTPRTRAIVVMHYGGFPCDMDPIVDVARRHKLALVEDAAHAPLSEHKGRKLGTIGDVGCFSFFSNKNISTAEGGMLVARSPEHLQRARLLRSHGMTTLSYDRARGHSTTYDVVEVGYNYRIDDIRAALALAQIEKLDRDLARRVEIRRRYIERLDGVRGVVVPFRDSREFVSNYIFPVVLDVACRIQRDDVRQRLAEAGIQTSVHYPAVHRFSVFKQFARSLPHTEFVADRTMTLPMYARLQTTQVDEIAGALAEIVAE